MKPTTGEGVAPQCNTSAECLRELARVMEQFGIASPLEALLKYGRWGGLPIRHQLTVFECIIRSPELLTLAIAEVEGKPVFIGDELYSINFGIKVTVAGQNKFDPNYLDVVTDIADEVPLISLSWNPPKPKTVMVELAVEDAEKMSRDANERLAGTYAYDRVGLACKLALEKLK